VTTTGWAAAAGAHALAFVDALPDGVAPCWIDGPDGHHLQRVRRLQLDEDVVLADGAGRWVPTRVVDLRDGAVGLAVAGAVHREPVRTPEVTIAFAPAKRDHGTEVTHQLVELGVDRIVPLRTERGVVRWDGARGEKHVERLRRVAREAAMQCHRARIPDVATPCTPAELATRTGVALADPRGATISRSSLPDGDTWTVLVGPEGGFSVSEFAALADAVRIGVGPHVLRSVTAPAAVAAALTALRDVPDDAA
jgi:16S rRNA (uracil1498-N3)-methyltransferase